MLEESTFNPLQIHALEQPQEQYLLTINTSNGYGKFTPLRGSSNDQTMQSNELIRDRNPGEGMSTEQIMQGMQNPFREGEEDTQMATPKDQGPK